MNLMAWRYKAIIMEKKYNGQLSAIHFFLSSFPLIIVSHLPFLLLQVQADKIHFFLYGIKLFLNTTIINIKT